MRFALQVDRKPPLIAGYRWWGLSDMQRIFADLHRTTEHASVKYSCSSCTNVLPLNSLIHSNPFNMPKLKVHWTRTSSYRLPRCCILVRGTLLYLSLWVCSHQSLWHLFNFRLGGFVSKWLQINQESKWLFSSKDLGCSFPLFHSLPAHFCFGWKNNSASSD